jgi:hypothetical protein
MSLFKLFKAEFALDSTTTGIGQIVSLYKVVKRNRAAFVTCVGLSRYGKTYHHVLVYEIM